MIKTTVYCVHVHKKKLYIEASETLRKKVSEFYKSLSYADQVGRSFDYKYLEILAKDDEVKSLVRFLGEYAAFGLSAYTDENPYLEKLQIKSLKND